MNLLPLSSAHEVRDNCLCVHVQRAARSLARRFDEAFRPLGLTNGQFSLLMILNRPKSAKMDEVSAMLAMDRTTLTAALKPLVRRTLVKIAVAPEDRRSRNLSLTPRGRKLIFKAHEIWKREHAAVEMELADTNRLRADLRALTT